MSDYRHYRRDHPGPITGKSFQFWKKNGGKDLPSFVWKGKSIKKINKKQNKKKQNNHKKQQKEIKIYKNEIKNMNGGNVHYH